MRACLLALIERNRALNWEVTIRAMLPPLPGETAIRVQGETLADRRLPAFAFDQVFEEGGFKNGSQYGRRRVAYVRKDDLWLVFKLNPELPGVESAAGHLSRLIFGSWMSPLTELMRWQDQFPVLVSGGVPGVTLQDALTDNPDGACALVAALMFAPMASALRVTTWRSAGRPGRVVGSSPVLCRLADLSAPSLRCLGSRLAFVTALTPCNGAARRGGQFFNGWTPRTRQWLSSTP